MPLTSSPPQARPSPFSTLVDELLREQQELSAVERFAQTFAHETEQALNEPAQARYYKTLLPAAPPGPGEQYAFEIDLDRCSGCKACVTACHSLNGLDDNETWRDVGMLVGGTTAQPLIQHVTAACHHCIEPACLNACPTLAYEKDPRTGIVKHLDDQCFGCQYCSLACPYDVPKYHHEKGIVRKCDMCSQRLAVGEAPACVQACPHESIRIGVVSKADVVADCEANNFLPGAPDPQLTTPTTTYRTSRVFPRNVLPADYHAVRVEDAHPPLIVMLVLTQLSVGACFVSAVLESRTSLVAVAAVHTWQAGAALFFGLLALAASTMHLGRPHLAWRGFLNLRTSWLSREIVAFGLFAATTSAYALGVTLFPETHTGFRSLWQTVRLGVLSTGLVGVFCSVMIYHGTRRPTWVGPRTFVRFFGTAAWLGLQATLFSAVIAASFRADLAVGLVLAEYVSDLGLLLIGVASGKLLYETLDFLHLLERHHTPLRRLATLMNNDLAGLTIARYSLGLLGGVILPWTLLHESPTAGDTKWFVTITVMFAMSIVGEFLERTLFFMTAVAPRMPGALRT